MAKFLSGYGSVVKTDDIKSIEVVEVRNSGNSVGTKLSTYRVKLADKLFIVGEKLLPNAYGSTAFSTECELYLMLTKPINNDGEGNSINEQVESEDV